MSKNNTRKVVISSGYYNPLHSGHINLMREAKKIGDFLVVIVNNDEQVKIKGGIPFMSAEERMEVVGALRYVDDVVLSVDKDGSVIESLKMVAKKYPGELFFAQGGDRNSSNIPEVGVCNEYNIKIINNVGGGKIQSSSWLLKDVNNFKQHAKK